MTFADAEGGRPPAAAVERSLFVVGDSLAEGTRPYIPHELPHWRVRQSAKTSRHASAGAAVMRRYGDELPRVIHASLGTNDDPSDVTGFRSAIRAVMRVAGGGRCVVWANIVAIRLKCVVSMVASFVLRGVRRVIPVWC